MKKVPMWARNSIVFFVVALLCPTAYAFELAGVYRDETANQNDSTTPTKVKLKGAPEFKNNFHGTYESRPYILISDQNQDHPDGTYFVYSDIGNLSGELHPSGDQDKVYDLFLRKLDGSRGEHVGKVNTGSDDCAGRQACFTLTTSKDLGIPQTRNGVKVLYIPVGEYAPDTNSTLDQTFGNMFSPIAANFSYILKCWHMARMSTVDYQDPGCDSNLFAMPASDSYGYKKVAFGDWHNAALPFSWTYASTLFENGEDKGTIMENGDDVASSQDLKVGVSAKASLFGVDVESHVNVATHKKAQEMYDSKLTYSKAEYLSTQFALVLHRYYADLDKGFRDRITRIADLRPEQREREYKRLVNDYGTHYANAITFGAKGERELRMSQAQVMSMHEQGIDVSVGMTAGYDGVSAGVDVDTSSSNMEKITQNTSREDRHWFCYSGGSCNEGIPSGDSVLPIQLDLRPISDLLAPPFFYDDVVLTQVREGVRKEVIRQAYRSKDNMDAPTTVFATVTGFDRTNLTTVGATIAETKSEGQPCGVGRPCKDGTANLTSADGSKTHLLTDTPSPVSWKIPGTLDPVSKMVSVPFKWSGKCTDQPSTWELDDSAYGYVSSVSDLTVDPNRHIGGIQYVMSPNCVTAQNPMGLVTTISSSTITKVESAGDLLGQ